jgi:pimeloyl-ACP methyl ester carboxylesterase
MSRFLVSLGGLTLAVMVMPSLAAPRTTTAVAASAPVAVLAACPAGTPAGARCGTVAVPLDRADPGGASIRIAFQLYPATDTSRPALSTIVSSNGGPGVSNIASAGFWLGRLQPLMSRRNFLAIDHRGIGASAAIDCPGLQHVQGDQVVAARDCGAQLGAAAYRYGSGDVADDIDAVREALHLDKIDYYGVSYGAVDVRAYAYRHADHLRSAILDSPYNSKDAAFVRTLPTAMARISTLVCERSPSCSAANRQPDATFTALVRRLQRHPVSGIGYDANGTPHPLVVDERALLSVLYNDYFSDPAFLNQGEIFAAATALRRGDATPLLRLVAESPAPTDFGPSDGFASVGADYAVFCADSDFPWNKNAPEATREAQYQAALTALPKNATTPFTPAVWAGFIASQPVLLIPGADACVPWPVPVRPNPPFPVDQAFPSNVPALLLGGGLDYLDVNTERSLIPLFPSGKFVTVANAGHVTTFWNPCAQAIALRFLQTLHTGDTRCAGDTTGAMGNPFGAATGKLQLRGLASFPVLARQAEPAQNDPAQDLDTARSDRRIANVAWLTVTDAVYRLPRMTGASGRGLRGGGYTVTNTPTGTRIDYQRAQFTNDVYVSGQVILDATNALSGSITLIGPRGRTGTLTIHAVLWDPAHPLASLRGSLGGKAIAVLTQTR